VHKQQLGHVAVPKMRLLLSDRRSNHGRFLGDDGPFLRRRFAGPHFADQIPQFHRHDGVWWWLLSVFFKREKRQPTGGSEWSKKQQQQGARVVQPAASNAITTVREDDPCPKSKTL